MFPKQKSRFQKLLAVQHFLFLQSKFKIFADKIFNHFPLCKVLIKNWDLHFLDLKLDKEVYSFDFIYNHFEFLRVIYEISYLMKIFLPFILYSVLLNMLRTILKIIGLLINLYLLIYVAFLRNLYDLFLLSFNLKNVE